MQKSTKKIVLLLFDTELRKARVDRVEVAARR